MVLSETIRSDGKFYPVGYSVMITSVFCCISNASVFHRWIIGMNN